MSKILHFRNNCIGCGSCTLHAPGYWEMDEKDGKANLKRGKLCGKVDQLDVYEGEIEQNVRAAEDCPVSIIHVYDDNGKKISPK
ncbi:MAG: ferredoxin [Candidatus Magasanikbacteria bacterium]|mgnify:FL=1|jgi:ferredoxin|nr:ferredoxin [Candidatus Magasanikbacteria bacterium]MBT4220781.1 ferredoxin [Candidatus Magasanikbacteria bacterium]MBT4350126.1 ferredoxin [Candidatus Magasanikbacteria bacterium]MBT4541431.1 ferredoxin [Candidatus Magasanikbacteria bacterium]MBT6253129.1 ferredoxin [Candidatus Magasanikbacteria bacterium]